jgi:serine/threonine protein kinase
LAKTLGQVHQHGRIHKDIKPANVLVDDTGNASEESRAASHLLPAVQSALQFNDPY